MQKLKQKQTSKIGHTGSWSFSCCIVQKTMYDDVDSVVYVYAPEGNDLKLHLDRINSYNSRAESPTKWKEEVYTGNDFFEKMIAEKKEMLLYCQATIKKRQIIFYNHSKMDSMFSLINQW